MYLLYVQYSKGTKKLPYIAMFDLQICSREVGAHSLLDRFIDTSIGWLYFHQKVYQSLSNFCLSESIYKFLIICLTICLTHSWALVDQSVISANGLSNDDSGKNDGLKLRLAESVR